MKRSEPGQRERDIAWGRASRIPECCVMWFVDHDTFDNRSSEQQNAFCGYVPCPACTEAKTFVEIHHCDQHALYRGEPCPGCGMKIEKWVLDKARADGFVPLTADQSQRLQALVSVMGSKLFPASPQDKGQTE